MFKMAAFFTDAFYCLFFFWKGDEILAGRTLCTAGSQGQGLFLVYVILIFFIRIHYHCIISGIMF